MSCYRLPIAKYIDLTTNTNISLAGTAVGTSYTSLCFNPIPGGTITGVLFYTATTNGTCTMLYSIETANGYVPSGTLIAPGVEGTITLFGGTYWLATFGTAYNVPVNATTVAHLVLRRHLGTLVTLASRKSGGGQSNPRVVECIGTTITQRNLPPCFTPLYSSGTYSDDIAGPSLYTTNTFNNTSIPNEYGNMFVPTDTIIVSSVRTIARLAHANSTMLIRIYDAGGTVLTNDNECTYNSTVMSGASDNNSITCPLGTSYKLYKGSTYYVTMTAPGTSIYYTSNYFIDSVLRDISFLNHQACIRTGGTGTFTVFSGSANAICVQMDCLPLTTFVPERDVAKGTTYTFEGNTFTGSLVVGGGTGGTTIINNYYGVSRSRVGGGL